MNPIDDFISATLKERENNDSIRSLKPESSLIDFCSNDYLGFARSPELKAAFEKEIGKHPDYFLGSTGSRLLSGNNEFTEDLESEIAGFHNSEASLLFNSGYDANIGIFASLPQRGDTIICDQFVHASIIDGVRLSHATRYVFKHNDLNSLEEKLKLAKGRIYIAIETVYSMDGDEAPLQEICALAEQYNAAVIADEAHAIGVFGRQGRGLADQLGLNSRIFARIVTFGKALGVHGAAVIGSMQLRTYLINYARSFIYTTASPILNHLAVKVSYAFLQNRDHQSKLNERIEAFKSGLDPLINIISSRSAIHALLVPGNVEVREKAKSLQSSGFDVRPILSPTVPQGAERLRISLHNHNSIAEILNLSNTLNQIL
ncbi:aminotransferase class I/II-fold pyridoxal phosphate-dependent enzyme [Daejeonella sp.]|uniref:aminotransferase class I/II-fold pyridoxal phosphate-dependent enzyme n=1 Tax=Daejeonella sp. TaxID=2805397 RepID=UPI00398388D3